MRIQHNIAALNAHRQLGTNNSSVSKNLEKLSSGYRINRAGDDAAGLAISEKMRAQIKGLETASKNANDGISLVQTAEGALTEVHSMLNRMTELATQSANGTYQDGVDRNNLQKEVDSLTSEINRISESTNFNGINLLDGSVNKTEAATAGTVAATTVNAVKSGSIGTFGTNVDGKKIAGEASVAYSQKIYAGDISNTSGASANLVFSYKDNEGASKTVTLAVADGTDLTTEDIAKALKGDTVSGVTATDTGTAASATAGEDGNFNELYDVTSDGNIITITAKADKSVVGGSAKELKGNNLNTVALTNTFAAADKTTAEEKLKQNYADATAADIAYGSSAGTPVAYKAEVKGSYQVASTKLTLAGDGAANHNKAVQVGSKTYVIQSGTDEVKGLKGGETVVKVGSGDTAAQIATKLAAAITADEANNGGYVASDASGVLTISESTAKGADILDDATKVAGKAADIAKAVELTTKEGTTTGAGTLVTFDASRIQNGTSVNAGGKNYVFVNDASETVASGSEKIVYDKDATSADLAKKLADALTADGATGVTADGASVKLANSSISTAATTTGAGLTLQIGDTAENFNKISVKIGSTSAENLGIADISIKTQEGAAKAIDKIKDAINSISSTRGDLGAIQNRLEHTINNLGVTTENLTAAESRIRDVDMAKEMMDFTKNNILTQASQAMLAQANQLPQGVLQLLQ